MGWLKDKATRAAYEVSHDRHGNPALDRRATQVGSSLAQAAAANGQPVVAAVISAAACAAVAAETVFGTPEPPEGGYATFSTDSETKRKGWRR